MEERKVKSIEEDHRLKISNVMTFLTGLSGIVVGVFANLISIAASGVSVSSNVISRLLLFSLGLFLLSLVIVIIGSLLRHRNREVILLKQRLAEIYLSALKKSAFNPQLKSIPSHE